MRFSGINGGTCQEAQCVIKWNFLKTKFRENWGNENRYHSRHSLERGKNGNKTVVIVPECVDFPAGKFQIFSYQKL